VTKRIALGLTIIALSIAAPTVRSASICWIDRVELTEDGVRVFHKSGLVNGIRRADGRLERPRVEAGQPRSFDLREGDSAAMSGGAHDWCSVKAQRHGEVLGVQLNATSRPHGLPATTASQFVPGGTAQP
jgi:hypothetical protein